MPTITKTPGKIYFTGTTSEYTGWQNIQNLYVDNANAARTKLISGAKGKNPRIQKVNATKFNFNLPEGAEVTKIRVEYKYKKDCKVANKYPEIAGPNVTLLNSGIEEWLVSQTGTVPPKQYRDKNHSFTWDGIYVQETVVSSAMSVDSNGNAITIPLKTNTLSIPYKLPSREQINSDNFGVKFAFPKNTSANEGYIDFRTLKIIVTYKLPTYAISIMPTASTVVKDLPTQMSIRCDNKSLCSYTPTLRLAVPSDMIATNISTDLQAFRKIADGLYEWTPYMNETVASATLNVELVPHTSGTNTITVTEQLTNASSSITLTVETTGTGIEDQIIDPNQIIYAIQNSSFSIPVKIPVGLIGTTSNIYLHTDTAITIGNTSVAANSYYTIPVSSLNSDGEITLSGVISSTGTAELGVSFNTSAPDTPTFIVKIVPSGFTVPRLTILKLEDEEADRLGHGYNYTINSQLQIMCAPTSISSFEDYFRTFRMGVVNNTNSTDKSEIFNACKEWSNGLTAFNEFEPESVTFTYNENYPVYIIFTGNYNCEDCDLFSLRFTEPKIMETTRSDTSPFVIFPVPIKDIVYEEGANMELPHNITSNSLILYDFELPDGFNEFRNKLAVRGVALRMNVATEFSVICSAKLKSPTGMYGERSALITNTTDIVQIGDSTDRWGFLASELINVDNFELELSFADTLNESTENMDVNIKNAEVIIYYGFYEDYVVDWFVEGENMAGYNAFLQDVTVPEGIKTNTKFLTVDGTDTNNAFRQNIKEKEITVEFSIDECNIDEATATLQDLTEILITERDELYRPIPKRIEFSHYPGIFWEYIMEDTIDANADGGSYTCKVKLTIPDGTAYTVDEIQTGRSGRVGGLAKINPVLTIIPTATHIEIAEEYSEQKFLMSYNDWTTNDLVEIDCKNRKITLQKSDGTTKDITAYTDYNTSWFLLYGQFLLNETGCLIQSVSWRERR